MRESDARTSGRYSDALCSVYVPPRPACGERIEVRGLSSAFSEVVLASRFSLRESRSLVAKESNRTRANSLASSAEPKFRGLQFRRQHPLHSYVLDFYWPAANLAIELDGGGHDYRVGQIRDRTRSEFLASQGIIVLRFWNHQVRQELDSVLKAIWFALEERCPPKPSP